MHLVPAHSADRVTALYIDEWRRRHPATPPPELSATPSAAELADPLWAEARAVWNAAAEASAGAAPLAPPAPANAWIPMVGGLLCPNGHSVGLDQLHCGTCAEAVPPQVAAQARELTTRVNDRAGLALLRMGS